MKIAVLGGTGLIGSRVVRTLNDEGHEAVPHARSTGVDLRSGHGLPAALKGADVVVNLTRPRAFDSTASVFFRESMENLLVAAQDAGVGHAVILSIVGVDRVPGVPYYRAKALQEALLAAGPVPYSIVRSTQFFEFVDEVLSWTSDEHTVHLPATRVQPVAADEVARAVAAVSAGSPLEEIRDIAGPEVFALDELARITLAARGDDRAVVTDPGAGLYAAVPGDALLAGPGTIIVGPTYRQWLKRPVPAPSAPERPRGKVITKPHALTVLRRAYGPDYAASVADRLPDRIDFDRPADLALLFELGLTQDRLFSALGGEV